MEGARELTFTEFIEYVQGKTVVATTNNAIDEDVWAILSDGTVVATSTGTDGCASDPGSFWATLHVFPDVAAAKAYFGDYGFPE